MRKNVILAMLSTLLILVAAPTKATGFGDLLSEANKDASNLLSGVSTQVADNPLTELLSKDLDVNDTQAAGGAGAMLAMAYQALGDSQGNELLEKVPGMDSLTKMILAGLGSNLSDIASVQKVFNMLGLDPEMVQKFAPVIINYLTGEGASEGLTGALTSLWAPKTPGE
ncbi:DUF2780 domain-containing protein [Enterovibrio nigricans]|uniref:DUF2780 domain-containing protein n=1 Tax=Enterovibrio nigricans DSM 22720 TaxID=1121868 RepID=A0A1T4UAA2_9GAMM|nr:DUF2780 domain-containing protein [Enterovibrio nigricans]PKF51373.1 hypothetical protein AT251_04370 [Enterovibrio nigricans]SKA49448.1 Protein of unknown function VcgC/VcgE [Enterovibrio nigricans DSM 22720]